MESINGWYFYESDLGQGFNAFQAKYGHFQAQYFQQHSDNEAETALADNMFAGMNDFVDIAFNYGLTGLLLYVSFWVLLFLRVKYENIMQDQMLLVSVSVLVIFLVSSSFYFTGRMLPVSIIAFFCAAYIISSGCILKYVNIKRIKMIAPVGLLIYCFAIFITIRQLNYYFKWKLADQYDQYGYVTESDLEYEKLYSAMKHNGLFLYFYAKILYENKEYLKCFECLKKTEGMFCSSNFYTLFGDTYFQLGKYCPAKQYYEYALQIVPNRFIPLYKLFQLYIYTGQKDEALQIAQTIIKKPIKIDSIEVQKIISDCKEYFQKNKK